MNRRMGGIVGCLLLAGVVAGCSSPAPSLADTGSRQVVQTYFEALVRRDWNAAYSCLHPDSRQRWTLERFKSAAEAQRLALGFEPSEVRMNSCEEQGTEATAHVLLTGSTGGKAATFRDAVALKQSDAGWGVVLPHNFGTSRTR
jgi:hypothetical protein